MNKQPAHLPSQKVCNVGAYIEAKEAIRNSSGRISNGQFTADFMGQYVPIETFHRLMGNPDILLMPLNFKGENKDGTRF